MVSGYQWFRAQQAFYSWEPQKGRMFLLSSRFNKIISAFQSSIAERQRHRANMRMGRGLVMGNAHSSRSAFPDFLFFTPHTL